MDIGCLEHDFYTRTPTNKFGMAQVYGDKQSSNSSSKQVSL